jgi:fused signal recognition particle receptor
MFSFFKRKPRPDTETPASVPGPSDAHAPPETAEAAASSAPAERSDSAQPSSWFTRLREGFTKPAPSDAPQPEPPPEHLPPAVHAEGRHSAEAPAQAPPPSAEPAGWLARLKDGFTRPEEPEVRDVEPPAAPPAEGFTTAADDDAQFVPEALGPPAEPTGWFTRLKDGLTKTRRQLGGRLVSVFGAGRKLDEAFYEELETVLLTSDVGVQATEFLIEALRARARSEGYTEADQLREALGELVLEMLKPISRPLDVSLHRPFVIMLAGVNGSGKTTSIGKLARYYQQQGRTVLLAAGDTFRAAAREQLVAWGERNRVSVVTQQSGDAAAVIFDAVNAAIARGIDVVLADTAGRLPTQLHLMEEIRKVKRVINKALPGAPHEVLLVLDANTGQNALAQVKAFDDALGVTGLIMTKLDGTAKGGVIAAIAHTRARAQAGKPIPLRFIGVGEGIDDLRPFDAEDFTDALLGNVEE